MRWRNVVINLCFFVWANSAAAYAACRPVVDDAKITIAPASTAALQAMHVDRRLAFDILRRTAIPETKGCWGGVTGNFDGQVISAGAMQWNFGQKTLQFLLFQYRRSFLTEAAFDTERSRLMPRYGKLLFSDGCAHAVLSATCRQGFLAHQHRGSIDPDMAAELEALFSSDAMVQAQVDRFLSILTSVGSDLKRMFGDGVPSPLKVKWAMDTKVQQGSFPTDAEVKLFRDRSSKFNPDQRREELGNIVDWYSGLAGSLVEEGVRYDYRYNRDVWKQEIDKLYKPAVRQDEFEKFELLNLSFLRARRAVGKGGAFQCNSFQRRASIVLGRGMLGGRKF